MGYQCTKSKIMDEIVDGAFDLAYQPIFGREENKTIIFCEALLRPKSELYPAEAVDIAERAGISNYLFMNVCKKIWCSELMEAIEASGANRISINLSPYQINEAVSAEEFTDDILSVLAGTRVNPRNVAFEITESASIRDYDKANKIVRTFVNQGILVMADDFGCGSSNFELLSKIPDIRAIKLSRESVVSYMNSERGSEAWVDGVNSLKSKEDYIIICEGIDTDTQNCLDYIDCDLVQGFKFGKPQDYNGIMNMLVEQAVRLGGEHLCIR